VLIDEIAANAKGSRRLVLDRFHQLVLELREGVTRLLDLARGQNLGWVLTALDHYVQSVNRRTREVGPGKSHGREHPGLKREKGFICFCGHGARVEFRELMLKELK
jgi:hypothetical protein